MKPKHLHYIVLFLKVIIEFSIANVEAQYLASFATVDCLVSSSNDKVISRIFDRHVDRLSRYIACIWTLVEVSAFAAHKAMKSSSPQICD